MWHYIGKIFIDLILFYGITYSGHKYWTTRDNYGLKSFGWSLLAWIGMFLFLQ